MVMAGVSGMALYVPRPQVRLKDWSSWHGASWPQVERRIGDSFRMCASHESVYTMAANSVLRLIERNRIHPQNVGSLTLAVGSSTDGVPGASIVKSMVDEALERFGRSPLARACEVPEVRHSSLGGMYALKSALRFVEAEGPERCAIVVAADIAQVPQGTAGESMQGAGAVAMWVEAAPRLFEVDLRRAASASRAVDVRTGAMDLDAMIARDDFSGADRCLTTVWDAVSALLQEGDDEASLLEEAMAIIMQRPTEELPVRALSLVSLHRMAMSEAGRRRLRDIVKPAGADLDTVIAELFAASDLGRPAEFEAAATDPQLSKVLAYCCTNPTFRQRIDDKLCLGRSLMRQIGNLSCAALPAWIGAALEEAHVRQVRLAERTLLAIGYGAGDAAEAWPLRVVKKWRTAAGLLGFEDSLQRAITVDQATYETARRGGGVPDLEPQAEFVAERMGRPESYRYVA